MALFVTHSPVVGGAETVLATYLRLRPGQHRVLVLSDGECPRLFAEAGAEVTTLPVFRRDDPGRTLTVAEALTRLVAPILSFTADEVWQSLPAVDGRESSVHIALFPNVAEIVPGSPKACWKYRLKASICGENSLLARHASPTSIGGTGS